MKRIILTILLTFSLFSFAQEKRSVNRLTPEQRMELKLKKMKLDLDLNEKQMNDISKLTSIQIEKISVIKVKKQKLMEQLHALRFEEKKLHLDTKMAEKEAFKEILTDEQFKKWNQIVLAHQMKHQNRQKSKHVNKRL